MKEFDIAPDRRGSNCAKWDEDAPGTLPMWVADMDFRTAPCIIEALERRVQHGIFGYTHVPKAYYDAICNWFERYHNWSIDPSRIIYTIGVVPALSAIIKALTVPGDGVAVLTPVYNCFFSSIRNNGCRIVESSLLYTNGYYTIDYTDLEARLADPTVKLLILCNPHNPCGRVWTADELMHVADICRRTDTRVISDEIHCELTFAGHDYVPFATLDHETARKSVICISPTKAFNIAGLQIANIVCPDSDIRSLVDKAININEVCDVNPFGVEALMAAYNLGRSWLDELRKYLWDNYVELCQFMAHELPQIGVTRLEGTYLVWLDCRKLGIGSDELQLLLLQNEHLRLASGTTYGADGNGFLRLNIACPRSRLLEGLNRLAAGIHSLHKKYF